MENTEVTNQSAVKVGKKLSGWLKGFIVLFALFFAAGFATLGSFRNTGKSFAYTSGDGNLASFNLDKASGQSKLMYIYINVGNIYTATGSDITITVKRSTQQSVKPSIKVDSVTLGNIYSLKEKSREGGNFNWVQLAYKEDGVSAACISVSATGNFDLNEIVCIADDGKPIPISVNSEYSQGFTSAQKKQMTRAIDAQKSFKNSSASYYNFTQEEAYFMTSIHTVLGGKNIRSDSVYTMDTDFNSLATVLMLPSVAIFGDSPFALRLTPFLATCATLLFVYLLGSLLFKDEKYGFIFAFIFAVGGLATTVGRMGAPYALVACFLVASLYFMYRFFSKGISSQHIVKGGLNVLFSGLFAALALAMNTLAIFPAAGILTLFGFGMRRQKLAYQNALLKYLPAEKAAPHTAETAESFAPDAESREAPSEGKPAAGIPAKAEKEQHGAVSVALIGKKAKKLQADYRYKKKVSWAFAALSFLLATFVFMLLASVVTYNAYVKAFDKNPLAPSLSYASLLWKGISAPFKITNITEYTEYNAANVLAWLLPLKAATVYDGILETGSSRYLAWNVSMNFAVSVACLVAFAFSTVSVVSEMFTENRGARINKRIRRIYLVLLGGLALSMLSSAFVKNTSAVQSLLFGVFYIGFIPLAVKIAQPDEIRLKKNGKPKISAADVILIVCLAVFVLFFAASVPSMYGFELPTKVAKYMFGWMSSADNGYFRP